MRKRTVGVLFGVLVLAAIAITAGSAFALCPDSCELFWTPVTQYTDNTAIEPQDLPLSYIVEWDGVAKPATTLTSWPLPKPYGHGVAHTARVKARTASGTEGAYSAPFQWTSPVGIPQGVPGIGVR